MVSWKVNEWNVSTEAFFVYDTTNKELQNLLIYFAKLSFCSIKHWLREAVSQLSLSAPSKLQKASTALQEQKYCHQNLQQISLTDSK